MLKTVLWFNIWDICQDKVVDLWWPFRESPSQCTIRAFKPGCKRRPVYGDRRKWERKCLQLRYNRTASIEPARQCVSAQRLDAATNRLCRVALSTAPLKVNKLFVPVIT